MNAAIITARAGSKSIQDKNVHPVGGRPLVAYPARAALEAASVDKTFVSTDGESIAEACSELGVEVIWRPDEFGGDHVNHGDVIRHAVEWVDAGYEGLANVVLLLGNTVMIDGEILDRCLGELAADSSLDSVMTVWEAADDHPLRALEIHDGLLRPYGDPDRNVSTERQSYAKAYYYDQGVWAFRKECVRERSGPNPWWWMGKRSKPIVREWVTGRDVHGALDLEIAEWWLGRRVEQATEGS